MYFYPELSSIDTFGYISFLKKSYETNESIIKNRKVGHNDSYICQLIQKDSIDDFIYYINKNNYDYKNAEIFPSQIETNRFLMRRYPNLIEYSAFYGSLKIFKYLLKNDIEKTPSLWLYAIHGSNPEIIHLLEENRIEPNDATFVQCLKESIKCHHNEIANYILNNHIQNENEQITNVISMTSIKYFNFEFIKKDYINESMFFDLCKGDYFYFVQFLLKTMKIDVNTIRSINTEKVCLESKHSKIIKSYKKTPLFIAVEKGNIDIVKLLVDEPNIDPNIVSCSFNDKSFDFHDDIDIDEEKPALYVAVENQDIEIIKLLLNNSNVDPNIKYKQKRNLSKIEQSSLFRAEKIENNEIIKLLLSNPKIDVNTTFLDEEQTYVYEQPFLNEIIHYKNVEILELLFKKPNFDINAKCIIDYKYQSKKREFTALYEAILNDDIKFVKLLLDNPQIDVNAICHNDDNDDLTVLHLAVEKEKTEIVKLLLSNAKIDVNIKTGKSIFPWYEKKWLKSLNQRYSKKDFEFFEEEEEEIRQKIATSEKRAALHISAVKENIEIINILLTNHNIDVYVKDEKGRTPIEITSNKQIISLISNYVNKKDI